MPAPPDQPTGPPEPSPPAAPVEPAGPPSGPPAGPPEQKETRRVHSADGVYEETWTRTSRVVVGRDTTIKQEIENKIRRSSQELFTVRGTNNDAAATLAEAIVELLRGGGHLKD